MNNQGKMEVKDSFNAWADLRPSDIMSLSSTPRSYQGAAIRGMHLPAETLLLLEASVTSDQPRWVPVVRRDSLDLDN